MIVGTGVDLAEVPRIAAAIERFGERFLARVFTPDEILYCRAKSNQVERFAARFAAKEAALKALGTGLRQGISWQQVEVRREPSGRPNIHFSGRAAEFAQRLGCKHASLSLTHTEQFALAQVILED
jgi:holo-[acyl-carrier protein] synthase